MTDTRDPLAALLREAWRAALARHEAARAAGQETESARAVAERILALLDGKPVDHDGAVEDLEMRAAIAATIMAEVEALERGEG